jgi:REP element-mobilizing transposase RayT
MSYTVLTYHIIFATKERRPFIQPHLHDRLYQYMGGIIRNLDGQLLEANGGIEHAHLGATVPAKHALAEFIGKVKCNSTGWVHETFQDLAVFGWQDGYEAFTVSPSVVPKVLRYIHSQQEHHKKMSFEEELILLLKKHGVQFDERRLWA